MKKGPNKHSRVDADSDISSQDSEQVNKKLKALAKKRAPEIAIDDLAANKQVKKKAPVITHQQFLDACRTGDLINLELGLRSLNRLPEIAGALDNEALQFAAQSGQLAVVNRLLEIDSVRTNAAVYKNYALRFAASNGHLAVVNRLLEIDSVRANAAEVNNGALRWAAAKGHLSVVNRLLEIDSVQANAAVFNNEALRWAAQHGHLAVVSRLLEIDSVRTNAAAVHNLALQLSSGNGHLAVVNQLLEIDLVRANAAAKNNSALQLTAENGHLSVVSRLLEIDSVRANAAASYNYALRLAASNGHLGVVNRLLEIDEVKKNVDADSNDALKCSVLNKHYPVAIRLFKESATRQYMIDNEIDFFTSAFEDARQQYAKSKTTACLALKTTNLHAFLRKMILQAAFHDTECGKSSCLTAAPSTITNAVTFCQMFKSKAAITQPLVELEQAQTPLRKGNGGRP